MIYSVTQPSSVKLLLTSVCKPYGIRDGYAEALGMQMELFNNQITREQGVHSPRANFWTFPLYFLAENISKPSTVLDFPSWRDFVRELKNGYTHIGISFIQTNVMKARRMAEYIRRHYPSMKILLGGYGTSLPDVRKQVPCDDVCEGEGISWLREKFGDIPGAPVRHPVIQGVARKHVYGMPAVIDDSAVLFPGLGCTNACFFCSTSSKFKHQYFPILATGDDMFATCCEIETKTGVREFFVIDENFLKKPDRAHRLLELMEKNGKAYNFFMFASADIVRKLGVDFLVRLGVCGLWMGIESPRRIFEKQEGLDARALIAELQSSGITVISSSILFLEHHDVLALDREIDWAIDAGADMHQFMQLTPLPGTPLFEKYKQEGLLIPDFPYTRMSGQNVLNFFHKHFAPDSAAEITRRAFRRAYERNGPGLLNMAGTAINGYRTAKELYARNRQAGMAWNPDTLRYDQEKADATDAFFEARITSLERRARELRVLVPSAWFFAPNAASRGKAADTRRIYRDEFGPAQTAEYVKAWILCATGLVEWMRRAVRSTLGLGELVRQPPTRRVEYPAGGSVGI